MCLCGVFFFVFVTSLILPEYKVNYTTVERNHKEKISEQEIKAKNDLFFFLVITVVVVFVIVNALRFYFSLRLNKRFSLSMVYIIIMVQINTRINDEFGINLSCFFVHNIETNRNATKRFAREKYHTSKVTYLRFLDAIMAAAFKFFIIFRKIRFYLLLF